MSAKDVIKDSKAEIIKDGFQLPIRFENVKMEQVCFQKTVHGNYRECLVVLKNEELFVYN